MFHRLIEFTVEIKQIYCGIIDIISMFPKFSLSETETHFHNLNMIKYITSASDIRIH